MDSRQPPYNPYYTNPESEMPAPYSTSSIPAGSFSQAPPIYPQLSPSYPGNAYVHPAVNISPFPAGNPLIAPAGYPGSANHQGYTANPSSNSLPPGYPVASTPYTPSAYPLPVITGGYSPMDMNGIVAAAVNQCLDAATRNTPQSYPAYPAPATFISTNYDSTSSRGFLVEPTQQELREKTIVLQYCSTTDRYTRPVGYPVTINGWRSCVYAESNMFHKVEHDWEMAYLARSPGSECAHIEWRFDVSRSGSRIRKLKVQLAASKLYENGDIQAYVLSGNQRLNIRPLLNTAQKFESLKGYQSFSIVVELSGGRGSEAWQHAQLFRQPLTDRCSPFEVTVVLQ